MTDETVNFSLFHLNIDRSNSVVLSAKELPLSLWALECLVEVVCDQYCFGVIRLGQNLHRLFNTLFAANAHNLLHEFVCCFLINRVAVVVIIKLLY